MSDEETDYGVWPKMADMLEERMAVSKPTWEGLVSGAAEIKKMLADRQDGMVLVPRKPTKAMLRAAANALSPEKRPTKDWMSVSEKHAYRYEMMIKAYLEESDAV